MKILKIIFSFSIIFIYFIYISIYCELYLCLSIDKIFINYYKSVFKKTIKIFMKAKLYCS